MTDPALSVSTANGRYYVRPDRGDSVPSITNIINKKDKPGLKYWAAKECANYAANNLARMSVLTRDEVYQLVRQAPFQRRDDSPAAIGDIIHNWIDRRIKGDTPSHDEVNQAANTVKWMWQSFLKFEEHYHPEYTGSEFTVWSNRYQYAGTADLSCRINGLHVLVDTKTGQNIYPETAMQLAALANADVIITADGSEKALPVFDKFAILHLRPRSAVLNPVENTTEAFQTFLALKQVFDWDIEFAEKSIQFAPKIA
jgi:hypothetical protein